MGDREQAERTAMSSYDEVARWLYDKDYLECDDREAGWVREWSWRLGYGTP
jgi:hypothetical protein